MINQVFARNFVKKMQHTLNLKVNVMDERGVIIASASKERVGDFHLCAYEIIQNNLSMLVTKEPTKELIGVNAPGVNLRLTSNNETIGVIGVTGDPDEVITIAQMVKLTFETMYEYEYKKKAAIKGSSGSWNLSHILLTESPVNEFSIEKATNRLKLQDHYPRIPIYINLHSDYRGTVIQHFIDTYRSHSHYHHQDIALPVDKGILFMKAFRSAASDISDREYAISCIRDIEQDFLLRETSDGTGLSYNFVIGPTQLDFLRYQSIYQDLLWLSCKKESCRDPIVFLMDYLVELTSTKLTEDFQIPLFSWYQQLIETHMETEFFLETVHSLIQADMKLETAAQLLHLHKNSVIARLKKIKELLNINPISSPRDAILLEHLYAFMVKK